MFFVNNFFSLLPLFLYLHQRKKKQLMRIQGIKEIQERRLFHGTDIKNVDYICKYNFDVRLAGQHAHVFGKGKFIVLCKSEFLTLYHFFCLFSSQLI